LLLSAELGTAVSVDFSVSHFQSLEGDSLLQYTGVSIAGFALAVVILLEKIITILHKDFAAELPGFIVDIVVQVLLPVIYFGIRLTQVTASRDVLMDTVGTSGLAGVPWASRSVSLGDKVSEFFEGLEKFEEKIGVESMMATFYFIHATSALFRLIAQTAAHPRYVIDVNMSPLRIEILAGFWGSSIGLDVEYLTAAFSIQDCHPRKHHGNSGSGPLALPHPFYYSQRRLHCAGHGAIRG
jgi:hypothetical protein